MLAMGPRDLNSAPYSPVHCSSHSMTSFQSSELTELPVVEDSQLFAQRVHSARTAHGTPPHTQDACSLKCFPSFHNSTTTRIKCSCVSCTVLRTCAQKIFSEDTLRSFEYPERVIGMQLDLRDREGEVALNTHSLTERD